MAWFFASESASEGQLGKTAGQLAGQLLDGSTLQVGRDRRQSKSEDGSTLPEITIIGDVGGEVGKLAKGAFLAGQEARSGELSPEEFLKKATELFDTLDKNHDRHLAPEELAEELQNEGNKDERAQVIATLYGARGQLKHLHRDGLFRGPGISEKDLVELGEVIAESEQSQEILSRKLLSKFDLDADEKLTVSELTKAVAEKGLPDHTKAVFESFIKIHDVNGEIKVTDVLRFLHQNDRKMRGYRANALQQVELLLDRTWAVQTESNRSLFGNDDGGMENIDTGGISQGKIGDCYALATFASIAETNPQLIKEMIKDNQDGTYTVTFPGAKDEPITIEAPTDMERAVYNNAAGHGSWGAVLEKAYGAWCQKSVFRRTINNLSGGNTPTEGADGGALRLGRVMELLTGKDADWDFLDLTRHAKTKRKLTEALTGDDKVCVIASTGTYQRKPLDVTQHVYSVLDYDPGGVDGGTVTLFNPWGIKEKVSYKEFSKRFNTITYQKEKWTER